MIRRLVKEQQVGLGEDGGGERRAHTPASREGFHLSSPELVWEAQILEECRSPLCSAIRFDRLEPRLHLIEPERRGGIHPVLVAAAERRRLLEQQPALHVRVHHELRGRPLLALLTQLELL